MTVQEMTVQEAREIYLKSDCSYFIMCTQYYNSYVQYRRLECTKEQEDIWKKEKIQMLSTEIRKTGDFRVFERMYEIAVEFRNYENLQLMYHMFGQIKQPLTEAQSIGIAETILGKKAIKKRSGLIYWAHDIGQRAIAIFFMDEALELLNHPGLSDEELERRVKKDRRLCKKIISELNLNFSNRYLRHYYDF